MITNDPKNPQLSLSIGGSVESFATINPGRVVLFGPEGTPLSATVTITPTDRYPFTVRGVALQNKTRIHFRLKETKLTDRIRYELQIEDAADRPGRFYDVLLLKTDSPLRPELEIPVYGNIFAPTEGEKPKVQ